MCFHILKHEWMRIWKVKINECTIWGKNSRVILRQFKNLKFNWPLKIWKNLKILFLPRGVGVHTSQVFLQLTLIQLPTIPASLQSLICGSHNSGIPSSHTGHPLPYGFVLGVNPSSQQPYIVFIQSSWWPCAPVNNNNLLNIKKNKCAQCRKILCNKFISVMMNGDPSKYKKNFFTKVTKTQMKNIILVRSVLLCLACCFLIRTWQKKSSKDH